MKTKLKDENYIKSHLVQKEQKQKFVNIIKSTAYYINKKAFQSTMSSFIETTQQATTDMQDINRKILSHLKTYTFFIFYQHEPNEKKNLSILEKMNFSLKDEKTSSSSEVGSIGERTKQVELHFYNVNNHTDILHAISDIRGHSFQNKAKIIVNASEQKLSLLIGEFQKMKVDLCSIPILLNSNQFQSDISAFLGWKNDKKDCMAVQSLPFYRQASQQWIKSTNQRMDVWRAQIRVSRQKGQILQLINNKLTPLLQSKKQLTQYFISHFCIGYHASTLLNCKQKITTNEQTIGNSFISFMQRFKKFCCVSQNNMKSTTGIVNITLIDDNGDQIQILKQLRPGDSSEEESQADLRSAKYKQYRDVLSILLTNINIYQGNMLEKSIEGKINDSKIQLITFDSQKGHRKICSSPGQIKIKLQAQVIDVQVGESFYRLQHPQEICIKFAKKIKVGIDNQLVKC